MRTYLGGLGIGSPWSRVRIGGEVRLPGREVAEAGTACGPFFDAAVAEPVAAEGVDNVVAVTALLEVVALLTCCHVYNDTAPGMARLKVCV